MSGIVVPENTYTCLGYQPNGWNTAADGSGVHYNDGDTVPMTFYSAYSSASDVMLYSEWVGLSYTISFDANGGSGSMGAEPMVSGVSANLTHMAFTRAGYDFAGWNTAADGSGISYSDEQSVTDLGYPIVTLYAQWAAKTPVKSPVLTSVDSTDPKSTTDSDQIAANVESGDKKLPQTGDSMPMAAMEVLAVGASMLIAERIMLVRSEHN